MNSIEQIEALKKRQRTFFSSGKTRDLKLRKESLKLLEQAIILKSLKL
jgi:3-phenylpropionate/cinnamic acid dioxygenase small subunit